MMRAKVLAILTVLVLTTGVALADRQGSGSAEIFVKVVENVSVGVITPLVNLGEVQMGPVTGEITFRVDANVQVLGLNVAVSNLYKDDVPGSIWQIPVDLNAGVVVVNSDAVREQPAGSDNVLPYTGAIVPVGPYSGLLTQTCQFSAGQDGSFSEDVVIKPTWQQIDPELPTGEYSGLVVFTAVI